MCTVGRQLDETAACWLNPPVSNADSSGIWFAELADWRFHFHFCLHTVLLFILYLLTDFFVCLASF